VDFRPFLAATPMFAELGSQVLDGLAERAERVDVRSGEPLYEEGDQAEFFYVVLSGRMRVIAQDRLVGYVGRLEPVGEIAALMGETRSATVRAVRDSVLLRIAREDFLEFLTRHPGALLVLSRVAIRRVREQGRQRLASATEVQGAFAVIPASPQVPVMALAEALVSRLSGWPAARLITAAHVDAALGAGAAQAPLDDGEAGARLAAWLRELEGRHRYLIYAADREEERWALRCLRNADRVLVLAEANARPAPVPVLSELRSGGAPVELVLLRPDGDSSPYTLAWREQTGARAHYFVHPWDEAELASLARQVTGRGVGLVLGGGGARGFAHIGLVRALEQLHIPVDVMGGASMGALLAGFAACGFDSVEMAKLARDTFVRNNYLNDYAVPRVSLIRGRKFYGRLQEIFGERQIEELRRSYYCVSTNLTTGATVVHDSGELAAWIGTSMAVPGVAPPIAYEGELLCDGGVVDNLPTDAMQALERGSIVACNVSTEGDIRAPGAGLGHPDLNALLDWKGPGAAPRLGEILIRTATLTSDTVTSRKAAERADVFIQMRSEDIGLFDWKRLDELVERGYQHAIEQLTPLRESLLL
jgi:NTE family protein